MSDSKDKYEAKDEETFEKGLSRQINKHSQEGNSNTPDYILAQYLKGCLDVFATAVQQRETWHGRDPRPTHTIYGVGSKIN